MQATNDSVIAMNVLTAPNLAFAALKERPTLLVPLLLLIAAAVATSFLYMNGVDIVWFFEQQMQQNPDANADQIERFNRFIENVPQVGIAATLSSFAALGVGFALLLQALYFKIVTWITRDQVSYKHWFSMVAWCALPSLLGSLASIVKLLTSDVSLMPSTAVNPLTFANLFGIDTTGAGRLVQLAANIDPMSIWTFVLLIVCYGAFTARNLAVATGVVLVPTLVFVALRLLS
jgi:hypothetical protein